MSEVDTTCRITPDKKTHACLVSADALLREALCAAWPSENVDWTFFDNGKAAIGVLLAAPPDILFCSLDLPDMSGLDLAHLFKSENVYSQVPVLLCCGTEDFARTELDWSSLEIDDFLAFPVPQGELCARLDLALRRSERTLDANPLTRLPGNTSIIRYTQGLIDKCVDFGLMYCDVDHFKPFNDKYGFARGDEVLMMTSRILLNTVKAGNFPFSFVGHVGGDDYVAIVPATGAEDICRKIIAAFDGIVPRFYDDDDRRQGGIVSTDRQGILRAFPLMGLSIAVVFNKGGSLRHYGEASHIAMNLKKKAKEDPQSSYVLDRRAPARHAPLPGAG
ncbi:diguanylate cyclase [Desulfovibrio sp. OttesenSCG-928-I05]|nr:diguanylate cyclase [Desulfovibrio sp. OttesenSCG-928-I05]